MRNITGMTSLKKRAAGYSNLRAEMARLGITNEMMAETIGVNPGSGRDSGDIFSGADGGLSFRIPGGAEGNGLTGAAAENGDRRILSRVSVLVIVKHFSGQPAGSVMTTPV